MAFFCHHLHVAQLLVTATTKPATLAIRYRTQSNYNMAFHTGLTPTDDMSFHTGLTPTNDVFQIPLDSTSQDVLPHFSSSSWIDDLNHSNIDLSHPFLFTNEALTVHPDSQIQEFARRNSIDALLDTSLVAMPTANAALDTMPSFFEERESYGNIVGPSQGLQSDNFLPAMPLDLLTAPDTVLGASYSLPQDTQSMSTYPASDYPQTAGFEAGYAAAMNSMYPQVQQPMSALPVSDNFVGLDPFNMTSYESTFDFNSTSFTDLSQYDPLPQTQNVQARKISNTSAQSSTSPPPGIEKKFAPSRLVKYQAELPQRPESKPWVRINASTMGKNSRSGKINQYDASHYYSKVPHPTGPWTSGRGKQFTYNQWHEFSRNDFTASQLKDFIYQHPKSKDSKLTLYIQRSPADSKRRYPTSTLDKCRFSCCPMRLHGNKGSFLHGHYRVALDELSYKYGNNGKDQHNDPFQVAGYVHLYCLERFLDLPEICRLTNVKVEADGRQIAKEPNGTFAPALGGSELRVAINFIEECRKNTLHTSEQWQNYPSQKHYEIAEQSSQSTLFGVHRHTLNYALQMAKNTGRGGYVLNKVKPSNVAIHRGDLEMYCLGRKNLLSDQETAEIMAEVEKADALSIAAPAPAQGLKRRTSVRRDSVSKRPG
jgi:hypothetical protein